MALTCSRPFYQILVQTVQNPEYIYDWVFCPYTITGLGLPGVGVIMIATGFVGIKNWTEAWTPALTWLALMAPVLAATALPGSVLRQIAGVLTIAFAMLIVGMWWWWGRS